MIVTCPMCGDEVDENHTRYLDGNGFVCEDCYWDYTHPDTESEASDD